VKYTPGNTEPSELDLQTALVSGEIATTQWSQVLAARDGEGTAARQALENLCRTYYRPLYAFIRHLGSSPDEAGDLIQAYFTELLEKEFLSAVDAGRGRFRSFLFTSVRHFLSHQRESSRALKRGGAAMILSLDMSAAEKTYSSYSSREMTPEELFEHRWAMTLLARALDRLREESRAAGKERLFEQLEPYLTSSGPQVPYRQAAAALEMSEGAVKVAVHRLRKRFGECLRAELAETVADPDDVDSELRHMLAVLNG
jgi:RNA polymerase sigma factor (sigma-70 family)